MMDKFLQGLPLNPPQDRFDAKKGKKIKEISRKEYEQYDKRDRVAMPEISVKQASSSFTEVELGFQEEQAKLEAERCLECGCQVNETCFLRQYCTDYEVNPIRFLGSVNRHPIDASHPYILRDANKCINCGRCIRTCSEVQGAAVLGYIYRGFPTLVAPEFGESLTQTSCESCGKCINVCPVGALVDRNLYYKMNPLPKETTVQSCGLCGTGCSIKVEAQTGVITRITTPEKKDEPIINAGFNGRNICFNGRFGWQSLLGKDRLTQPKAKTKEGWKDITWQEAKELIKAHQKSDKVMSFEATPMLTLEEMIMLQEFAQNTGGQLASNGYRPMFTDSLWQNHPADKPYYQLEKYNTHVVIGEISHTLRTMIRLHQRRGKKLILIDPPDSNFNRFADALFTDLDELQPEMDMLFIYNLNHISEEKALAVWHKASQVSIDPGNLLMTSDYANLTGLLTLGIKPGKTEADFVFSYGAYPETAGKKAFKVAVVPFFEDSAPADLLLPQPTYLEIDGTAIANAGIVTKFRNPAKSALFNQMLKLAYELDWISPALAEPAYWNQKAELFLQKAEMIQVPQEVGLKAMLPSFTVNARLKDLHDMKNVKQDVFPRKS